VGVRAPRQPVVNTAKALLFRAALRTDGLRTLLSIDPTLPEWHAERRGGAALGYLADPSPDATGTGSISADDARARLRLGSGPHLLVYGDVSARKGIRELVGALSGHPRAPTLVIAGVQDAETRDYLRDATSTLAREPVVLDRFITETEEADLFAACDAVWLGYKGHYGMSGVLVQAYRSGKPVVATADGLIGWFCNGRELGPVIEDLSTAAIRQALDQLWPPSPGAPPAPSSGTPGRAHLLARHTVGEFKRTLLSAAA
jgi:glycosyltransferase involved in cell wall biosynthesis